MGNETKPLKSMRILVTPTSYGKTDSRLKTELESLVSEVIYNPTGKPLRSADVVRLLEGVDGYIAGLDEIDRPALAGANQLKVIARYGVGVDNVDLAAASEKGILVTNTPGANASAVAELAVGLILSLARRIPEAAAATRAGGWPRLTAISLERKTVSLLGFGAVGRQVARRLGGFDCDILAYDPYPDRDFAIEHNVQLVTQAEAVREADFLSLHLPLLPETRSLVNEDFLSQMKRGSFLINTARGELIDETALAAAIQSGRLSGAGLDVFTREPPDPDGPLMKLPQVLVTPHCSSHTDGAMNTMGWMALNDCLSVLRGEPPLHLVK